MSGGWTRQKPIMPTKGEPKNLQNKKTNFKHRTRSVLKNTKIESSKETKQ